MSFENNFVHTLISESVSESGKTILDFLPPVCPYSIQLSEHLMYLKACGIVELPANSRYTQKNFHSYLLTYSLSGNATLQLDSEIINIPPDSICFIDCRQEYTLHCSTPWSFHALFFDGYPVPYYYDLFTQSFSPVVRLPKASIMPSLFMRITAQSYHCVELQNAKLLTDILTHLLLIRNDIIDRPNLPVYLIQLKESFDTNYAEHFSLDQLSDKFHINKYQICRDFKKYFHTTPLQYINDVRLTHAKELLHTTNLQINEISYRVGFENVNSFIQLFKKQIGTTPAAYRKNGY